MSVRARSSISTISLALALATWALVGTAAPSMARERWPDSMVTYNEARLAKIRAFLGSQRGHYLLPGRALAYDNLMEATSHPPVMVFPTRSGEIRYASRHREGDTEGAVLFGKDGQVRAVALLLVDCPPAGMCAGHYKVTAFVRRSPNASGYADEMRAWGAAVKHVEPKVDIVWLGQPSRGRR